MKVGELIKIGAKVLEGRETALLDSEVLLGYVLGENKEFLLAHHNDEMESDLENLFLKYIDRVKKGESVAYVVQKKEFFGLDFFVDERVLVPRPETEMLVEEVLDFGREMVESGQLPKVLDVGTGSGCIAVAVAKNCEVDFVDAIDVEVGALEVAQENVAQHSVEEKVNVFESDLLMGVSEDMEYDIIVANLPYIGEKNNKYVEDNVLNFEPEKALFAGDNGLDLYEKLFKQIKERGMKPKLIAGEFCFGQGKDVRQLLNKYFEQEWSIKRDLAGIERIFIIKNY